MERALKRVADDVADVSTEAVRMTERGQKMVAALSTSATEAMRAAKN